MIGFTARAFALTAALALGHAGFSSAQEASTPTEKLIKDTKIPYQTAKAGVYRMVAGSRAGNTVFGVEERKYPWQDKNKNDILYAYIYCEAVRLPAGTKPSLPMLMRVAELNNVIKFGNLGMSKGKDGDYTFYRQAAINLRGTDAEQLVDLLSVLHAEQIELQKILKPYVDEGK